ncbi:MAG: DUF2062 domain-containing protein [Cyanobacteria bacterium J06592_8]
MFRSNRSRRSSDISIARRFRFFYRYSQRWFRRLYRRLMTMRGTPEYLARGLAVGVFAGCFPFFGFQTLMGVSLAFVFRGHKLLAAAGTWVSNPFTYVPIYLFNYQIGRWLLGSKEPLFEDWGNLQTVEDILAVGAEFTLSLLFGCFVVGIIGGILAYFPSRKVIQNWRKQNCRKQKIQPTWNVSQISPESTEPELGES